MALSCSPCACFAAPKARRVARAAAVAPRARPVSAASEPIGSSSAPAASSQGTAQSQPQPSGGDRSMTVETLKEMAREHLQPGKGGGSDKAVLSEQFWRSAVYEKAAAEGTAVPWDVGVPQPALASPAVVDRFKGRVLDAGSGLGDNTRWLASLPGVTAAVGIDVSPAAVEGANARLAGDADARDKCSFRVASLADPPAEGEAEPPFDALLDCGVFHCVEDEARYLRALTPRVRVGGSAVALEFSDGNPPFEEGMPGPRRVSEAHAREAWGAAGWRVDSVERVKFRVRPIGEVLSAGEAEALLMLATRER